MLRFEVPDDAIYQNGIAIFAAAAEEDLAGGAMQIQLQLRLRSIDQIEDHRNSVGETATEYKPPQSSFAAQLVAHIDPVMTSHRLGSVRTAERILVPRATGLLKKDHTKPRWAMGGNTAGFFRLQTQWHEQRAARHRRTGDVGPLYQSKMSAGLYPCPR